MLPGFPARPSGQRDPLGAPWPGLIPLRPLRVAEIFSAAARLVRTHLVVLGMVAFLGSTASAGAVVAVLASLPDPGEYFSQDWLRATSEGRMSYPPAAALWPLVAGGIISFITTIVVSGLSTALAAEDALGRPTSAAAAFGRLRGRWLVIFGIASLTGLLVFVGLLAFIIPGLVALAALLLATPVAVLEKAGGMPALRRSMQLSSGLRGRILGIVVLAYLATTLVSTLLLSWFAVPATIIGALIALMAQAVVSAFTLPWTAAVVALLYIDTRMRKENLAASLIRASMRS